MSPSRSAYLQDIDQRLACFARGRELAVEVAGHLEDSASRLEADGLEPEAAGTQAMARLGTPADIARAFAAEGEPLAVPTRFTRLSGWLAVLALPCWVATFALMFSAQEAERTHEWEGLPQTLWVAGVLTMATASAAFVVVALGLNRREGGLGAAGRIGITLLALNVVLSPMAWFIPGWGALMAIGLGALAFRLRSNESAFGGYVTAAAGGAAAALLSFLVLAVTVGASGPWSIPFAVMLLPALAVAALGIRLVREPGADLPIAV